MHEHLCFGFQDVRAMEQLMSKGETAVAADVSAYLRWAIKNARQDADRDLAVGRNIGFLGGCIDAIVSEVGDQEKWSDVFWKPTSYLMIGAIGSSYTVCDNVMNKACDHIVSSTGKPEYSQMVALVLKNLLWVGKNNENYAPSGHLSDRLRKVLLLVKSNQGNLGGLGKSFYEECGKQAFALIGL